MQQLVIKTLVVGQLQTNCYIVADLVSQQAMVIDPGDDAEYIINSLRDLNVNPTQIVATHGHFDHIMAAFELQQAYDIPFLISQKDIFLVQRMHETAEFFLKIKIPDIPPIISSHLSADQILTCGHNPFLLVATPGHTPGSMCLYNQQKNILFTGDTLFAGGSVGRTDFSYASPSEMSSSLRYLKKYPHNTQIYPGHGSTSSLRETFAHLEIA